MRKFEQSKQLSRIGKHVFDNCPKTVAEYLEGVEGATEAAKAQIAAAKGDQMFDAEDEDED